MVFRISAVETIPQPADAFHIRGNVIADSHLAEAAAGSRSRGQRVLGMDDAVAGDGENKLYPLAVAVASVQGYDCLISNNLRFDAVCFRRGPGTQAGAGHMEIGSSRQQGAVLFSEASGGDKTGSLAEYQGEILTVDRDLTVCLVNGGRRLTGSRKTVLCLGQFYIVLIHHDAVRGVKFQIHGIGAVRDACRRCDHPFTVGRDTLGDLEFLRAGLCGHRQLHFCQICMVKPVLHRNVQGSAGYIAVILVHPHRGVGFFSHPGFRFFSQISIQHTAPLAVAGGLSV